MPASRKFYTGVGLDPEAVQFLADLARKTERNRSWLINAIVLDQARRLRLEQEARAAEPGPELPTVIRM